MATLFVFVLVMAQRPDILKRVQDEIALVVGQSRLPDFEDRASLPYLECVIREAYRYETHFIDLFERFTSHHYMYQLVPGNTQFVRSFSNTPSH